MLNRFLGITVLSLLTTACGSMEVTDFIVNDREQCADTGICEPALIIGRWNFVSTIATLPGS